MRRGPSRLGVGVVGSGRVGAVLGNALAAAGHTVVGASAVSQDSRDRAADLLPGVPVLDVESVVERAELVLLTVPDDELGPLVQGLADLGRFQEGQLLVHTAGRHGTQVMRPATDAGALALAIHPAMTFTGTRVDLQRLVGAPFAVTAPQELLPIAQALVVEIGGEPVVLEEEHRVLYHAALAHGANHLVTLVAQAQGVLRGLGVTEPGAMLGPVTLAALEGALQRGDDALTGPVMRGDADTVAAHVQVLAQAGGEPDTEAGYRALATATAERARRDGRLASTRADAVLAALAGSHVDPPRPGARRPRVVHTVAGLRATRDRSRSRAVVMTMGALHQGHLELVRLAAHQAEEVVVTIFVNPLQFDETADLQTYPRTLEADLDALAATGLVDVVFAPSVAEVYPEGEPQVRVHAGAMGQVWEGMSRPGHFDGVLTVVAKLLHLTSPDVAVFGRKDAQQLAIVRRMAHDLDMEVRIVGAPTVRDPDGLAMSSRNRRLSPAERDAALFLPRAMAAAAAAAVDGPDAVHAAAAAVLAGAPAELSLDYLALVDPATLAAPEGDAHHARLLLVAAQVGSTRLIDNVMVDYRGE